MTTREPEVREKPPRSADPAGNERLTAMTGAVLLVLVAAECLTLLRRGPPTPLRRVTGPLVIVTTVAVLGSGVMLIVEGDGPGGWSWIQLHHTSFLMWAVVMVIHLASHVPELPRMLSGRADHARHVLGALGAPGTRWLLLCASLAGGLWLAFATYHLSAAWGGSGRIIP